MAMSNDKISEKRKNGCAVELMRHMLVKYSQKKSISFDAALLQFTSSSAYDALFDFETAIWREGPDYLMQVFEDAQQQDARQTS